MELDTYRIPAKGPSRTLPPVRSRTRCVKYPMGRYRCGTKRRINAADIGSCAIVVTPGSTCLAGRMESSAGMHPGDTAGGFYRAWPERNQGPGVELPGCAAWPGDSRNAAQANPFLVAILGGQRDRQGQLTSSIRFRSNDATQAVTNGTGFAHPPSLPHGAGNVVAVERDRGGDNGEWGFGHAQ